MFGKDRLHGENHMTQFINQEIKYLVWSKEEAGDFNGGCLGVMLHTHASK
jgi:hypothetical protein